jgi:hypothetical protein
MGAELKEPEEASAPLWFAVVVRSFVLSEAGEPTEYR